MNELALFAGAGGGILGANSLAGAPSALLSLLPIPAACSLPGNGTGALNPSPSGTMCEPSTESLGEVALMSSQADSPVRTSVPPAMETVLTENAADFGKKCGESLGRFDPVTSLWKTRQCLLFEDSTEYCATLPRWGLMRGGECWELQMLEQNTGATESGLWATPTTPTGGGNVGGSGAYKSAIKNGTHVPHSINPSLYEWLMGFPIGWTDLKPLEMPKSLCALQPHGES